MVYSGANCLGSNDRRKPMPKNNPLSKIKSFKSIQQKWQDEDEAIVSKASQNNHAYLEQKLADSEYRRAVMAKTLSELLDQLVLREQAGDDQR